MAEYQVRLKGQDGTVVAVFDAVRFLEYGRKLNAPAWHEIHHRATEPRLSLYRLDGQVEFWRRPEGGTWHLDCATFHRHVRWFTDESGRDYFSSVGRGYEDLLARRITLPPGEVYDPESAYDEYGPDHLTDVMRQLVDRHAGPGAAADRRFPGLTVEPETHQGPQVSTRFRYQNVLTALQGLAELGADFAVVGTGPMTFQFRAYHPRLGRDRTVGNLEGNAPVVFSVDRGNMLNPQATESALELVNYVYVAGQGQGVDRTVVERYDASSVAETPWNRCEGFADARHLSLESSLRDYGDAFLAQRAKRVAFEFQAAETPGCRYGVHWDLGDLVTARYQAFTFAARVVSVHVALSETSGEVITPTFVVLRRDQ